MPTVFERGPYLSAAVLCEKVLVEQDGVKSAIRMVDRVTHTVAAPKPPKEMEPFTYTVNLLLKLKSGWARGVMTLKLQIVKPSGELGSSVENSVMFEGEEDRGIDIVAPITFKFEQQGIYWIRIYLEDQLLTQVPFRVIYMPQVMRVPGPRGGPIPPPDAPPPQS